ncbi:hypothetical protein [Zavarzinia aquatilis]|uniref:Uncharacterized protein n=1 Tax=Zavarzinia aquatilis TaxID=2211142 RepID=A0A317EGD4_9PROT|nr:hypothetical protein [Zavarzinia aquatilis]PWR25919.1 hypothetical protein DKG74_02925 [Zavarzinia aquatilis]
MREPKHHAPPGGAGLPPLVRLLARNAAFGFLVAICFVAAMLLLDINGLGTLILHSPDGIIATFALTFATGLTFGGVQMGIAIMQLADDDADEGAADPGGGSGRGHRDDTFYRHRLTAAAV